jgi:hypothetical protein
MLGVTTRVLLYGEALAGSAFYIRKLETTASSPGSDPAAAGIRGPDGNEPSPPRAVIVRTLEFITELARAGVPQSKLQATAYLLAQPELFRLVGALDPTADRDPFVRDRLEMLLRCVREILEEPSPTGGPP